MVQVRGEALLSIQAWRNREMRLFSGKEKQPVKLNGLTHLEVNRRFCWKCRHFVFLPRLGCPSLQVKAEDGASSSAKEIMASCSQGLVAFTDQLSVPTVTALIKRETSIT